MTNVPKLFHLSSQRDSKINVSVAEDSKLIAASAAEDSKAMRTIAILTLIFLPATLVSVSTSFLFANICLSSPS